MIIIDELGDYIKYKCPLSNSTITFKLEKILTKYNVKIDEMNINWSIPKLFINLIKYFIDDLQKKYEIESFIQTILKDEWAIIKNDSYNIITEYEDNGEELLDISCNIDIALQNIINNLL